MEQYPNENRTYPQTNRSSFYEAPVMTVGNWIVTMLIMIIPLVNVIMLIVWAASSTENPNRKNWAIAQLIFIAFGVLIWILMAGAIISMLGGFASAFES
jgi:Na+/phosphate symporter